MKSRIQRKSFCIDENINQKLQELYSLEHFKKNVFKMYQKYLLTEQKKP